MNPMNQDQRLDAIMARVGEVEPLEKLDVPPELAEPGSFLKVLKARHYNWASPRFRKLFGMRFSVKLPPIEQLNTIFYPRPDYDVPIFIFFCMLTRRKAIAHLNITCPFNDSAYRQQWVEPFAELLQDYESFETRDRYPEWMKKYRGEQTIYGLFPRERIDDISDCCFRYLDLYLDKVKIAQPVTDPERRKAVEAFQARWVDDIRTQDKAQGMMAKMIGKRVAHRIFYEVTT